MDKYWTGLVNIGRDGFERPRCCGAGWEAVLERPPGDGWGADKRGLFVMAKRWETAQRALEQIWIAHHVLTTDSLDLYCFPHLLTESGEPIPEMRDTRMGGAVRGQRVHLGTSSIAEAALLAARASRHRDLDYALALLGLSQGIAAVHVMELDPSHWRHGPAVSRFPLDHARLAYSIIAAYAVLEQLGMQVRASDKRPSRRGCKWDPHVRQDLEDRLRARGVDLTEHALWTARGTPRTTERGRPTKAIGSVPWAGGRIRDHDVAVVDAVADLSWLRSKIASHRMDEGAESLTIYDVGNAQYLARRFFLSAVGWLRPRGMSEGDVGGGLAGPCPELRTE